MNEETLRVCSVVAPRAARVSTAWLGPGIASRSLRPGRPPFPSRPGLSGGGGAVRSPREGGRPPAVRRFEMSRARKVSRAQTLALSRLAPLAGNPWLAAAVAAALLLAGLAVR